MKLKITKIDNSIPEVIHDEIADIRRVNDKLYVNSKNIKCEFDKDGMYLLRRSDENITEGLFNPLSRTRMVVETEYGQTFFDVKTLDYKISDYDIHLKYEIYSNSNLVGTFQFHFALEDRRDGVNGYA